MKKSKTRRLAGFSAGRTTALLAAVFAAGMPVQAADTVFSQTVASYGGKDMFELLYYAKGDGPKDAKPSVRNPSSAEMQGIASGWKIWADVLGPGAANPEPCSVDVMMDSEKGNAHCGSELADGDGGMTLLGDAIVNGSSVRGRAFMDLGTGALNSTPDPVPLHSAEGEIYSTAVHEAGHGLGISSSVSISLLGKPVVLSNLDKHLVSTWLNREVQLSDVKDLSQVVRVSKSLKGGDMYFLPTRVSMRDGSKGNAWNKLELDSDALPPGAFLVGEGSNSGVFFRGPETMKTLNAHGSSGLPGVRINGFELNGTARDGSYVYLPDLSHLELARSMMSHQNYRNYNFFMEAELAVLKDIGYRIDLKRFYGSSIYGNNLNVVNDFPFYARSADGRGWLAGQPSEETFGVGLHVYGEGNEVRQRADLLTKGEAAVGVRIDGANTKLTVLSGARIHADGTNGAGLLVAYGKNTDIAVLGDVRARGAGGAAARFDFGGNYLGDNAEIRGSYILRDSDGTPKSLDDLDKPDADGYPLHLKGPIVRTFNVAGSLEGRAASIYMSENAFVKEINILAGASVKGDIVSLWDANNPLLQAPKDSLYTSLVFGRRAKADGGAGEPDPGFDMVLEGSVTGPKGIDMELSAGRLIVEGETHVHDMKNFGWLGVTGLESTRVGTVSGTFTQEDGVLQSWVTPDGSSTYLLAARGTAQGSWAVTPDKGYWVHRKAVPVANAPVFFRDGTKTAFSSSLLAESPSLTLSFGLLDASGSLPVIGAVRADDAYSRHATRGSGAEAGRALSLANRGVPSSQMQALVTELDFMDSRAAIDRALSQLSADSFSESFAHALGRQQALSQRLLARMLSQLPKGTAAAQSRKAGASAPAGQTGLAAGDGTAAPGKGWTVWGSLFGMADSQSAYGSSDGWYSTGCGLMGGADKDLGDGLAAGFDLALVSDRFEAGGRQDADASSQGLFLGVHGSFAPDAWDGAYLLGGVRFGFDVNRMQRSVSAGAYHRSHDSEWTGWSGAFMLGAGRDWFFGEEKSVRLGPLATLQYAFTSHPDFEEDGGAEALRIDGGTADSLAFLLGAHLGASREIGSGCRLDAELMAGWRHELLEGSIRTSAAFAENPSASFTSARRLSTRDAGVLQASLRIAHEGGFFAELDLGGEARTAGAGVTGGLRVGFEF